MLHKTVLTQKLLHRSVRITQIILPPRESVTINTNSYKWDNKTSNKVKTTATNTFKINERKLKAFNIDVDEKEELGVAPLLNQEITFKQITIQQRDLTMGPRCSQ